MYRSTNQCLNTLHVYNVHNIQESLPTILWNRRPAVTKRDHSSGASSDEGVVGEDHDYFPASRLFEYRWPLDQDRAELYFLQEQVAEFLRIRRLQRKYPDMLRRTVDVPEKKYLMSKGVVTETQSNMGLVAVRSDDVLEVMSEDFPEKYQEYMSIVQEREFQNTLQLKILETRKIALMRAQSAGNDDGMKSVRNEAIREVVEFNKKLALQRRQQHSSFHDRHTQITHVPRKALRLQPPPKLSRYPVALLPGQYSDYTHQYTPEELFTMPLNTAITLPQKVHSLDLPPPVTTTTIHHHNVTLSQSHSGMVGGGASGMVGGGTSGMVGGGTSGMVGGGGASGMVGGGTSGMVGGTSGMVGGGTSGMVGDASGMVGGSQSTATTTRNKLTQSGVQVCSVCYRGRAGIRQSEPLLQCSECFNNVHPSCFGMSSELASVAQTYPWQCLDCKVCSVCSDPGREEEMVVCDHCDRGYHTFCLNMNGVPEGQWLCMECCVCAKCGSERGRGDMTQWTHQFIENRFIQTLCVHCSN